MQRYEEIARRLDEHAEARLEDAGRLSDRIWERPELGLQEFETSRVLCEALEGAGYSVERPYAGYQTAFNARYERGAGVRPTIGLLAQYDALPEVGHGCGHNMCGAISVLAARALKEVMEEFDIPGVIRVIGTPAEETTGEKVPMAEAGLFDDCDLVTMAHPETGKTFVDFNSLAVDPYDITFTGKAAHAAAAPWEGRNALNGMQLFFHALDMLRQHVRPEVRIHGIMTEGGVAANIVPSRATARVLFRAPWRKYLDEVTKLGLDCARGAAIATQTEATWKTSGHRMDNLLRNRVAESMLEEIMENEIGEPVDREPTLTGSTDMGAISWRRPTMELLISISDTAIAPHTVEFANAAHGPRVLKPLGKAARGLARAALKTLLDADLRRRMNVELEHQKSVQP